RVDVPRDGLRLQPPAHLRGSGHDGHLAVADQLSGAAGVAADDHRPRQGRDAGRAVSERGSALVEFAIASTVALTMIFGIIDFGRGLYTYHLVANAARAGSRWAMVRGNTCTAAGCPVTST